MSKKELLGKNIHRDLEEAISDREAFMATKGEKKFIKILGGGDNEYQGQIVQTIICEGDAIGAVILLAREGEKPIGEVEKNAAVIAANFLGRQMEG
jgi:AbrB family transcriptional regulator (stage V sporulation protein T)